MLKNLRKLYGRSANGTRSREVVRMTITTDTMNMVRDLVEVKRGGNGSAMIELAIRLLITLLVGGDDNFVIIKAELEKSTDTQMLANNLRYLAKLLDV